MGQYRHARERDIPLRWGNSAGADYFGGLSQRHAADGSTLYGHELPRGKFAYDLDAQVAAHHRIHTFLTQPDTTRAISGNSYVDELAHRHDIICWYAADVRDRMLQADPHFAIPDQPGKYRSWDELSLSERNRPAAAAAQARYHEIRAQGEIAFIDGMAHWQPESAQGQNYRQMALAGFQFLAGSYPQPHRDTMLERLPNWRNTDPQAIATPADMAQGIKSHRRLSSIDFEQAVTLPITDRELSFFYASNQDLQKQGAPTWTPHPEHPADRPGAMEHGSIALRYIDAQGNRVEKVLDLDNGRRFTASTYDAHGQLIQQETRTPTQALSAANHYTPAYRVETSNAAGEVISSRELAAGPLYPNPDTAIYREALGDLNAKYEALLRGDNAEIIEQVRQDLRNQQIQSQQLYLSPNHPLYREPPQYKETLRQQRQPAIRQETAEQPHTVMAPQTKPDAVQEKKQPEATHTPQEEAQPNTSRLRTHPGLVGLSDKISAAFPHLSSEQNERLTAYWANRCVRERMPVERIGRMAEEHRSDGRHLLHAINQNENQIVTANLDKALNTPVEQSLQNLSQAQQLQQGQQTQNQQEQNPQHGQAMRM